MEKLRGPINPCLIAEDLEVGWLEEFINNTGNLKFEDNPYKYNLEEYNYGDNNNNNNNNADYFHNNNFPNLEDKIPFLQMLQSVEIPQQQEEQNFQLLLRLQQHQKLMGYTDFEINHGVNDGLIMDLPVIKSENDGINQVIMEEKKKCKNKRNNLGKNNNNNNNNNNNVSVNGGVIKEKRKRKRTVKPAKNKQEVENQRMTHIAVERNRRRQMNEHLNALRSLMPPSYVQRGDQASIIGGAIDFVKELEQMLQSLEAKKKIRQYEENGDVSMTSTSTSPSSNMHLNNNGFMASPSSSSSSQFQLRNQFHSQEERKGNGNGNGNGGEGMGMGMGMRKSNNTNEEFSAERKSALADIEVVVIQNHVNLKIKCERRHGQLLKAIVAFEELRLNVLHLNITSLHNLVHYSFNLKIEEDCKLGSADEVARAVHQIFSLINLSPQLN